MTVTSGTQLVGLPSVGTWWAPKTYRLLTQVGTDFNYLQIEACPILAHAGL